MMKKTILEVANELAKAHKEEDPDTSHIYLASSSEDSGEVRLVEVSGSLESSSEVLPFRFTERTDLGIPYASVVILLSPEDWNLLKAGRLALPDGWGSADELQQIA